VLAVALLAPAGRATAGTSVSPLRGTTTIRWSGTVKVTLDVPRTIDHFTSDRMRLLVTGGTYASVRIVSPVHPYCAKAGLTPHCATYALDYLRELAPRWESDAPGPGHDHLTYAPFDPPFLGRGPTTFYLFTDGRATLEIRAPGLVGSATYTASRRFRGKAAWLPIRCVSGSCSARSGDPFLYGGAAFDLGKSAGAVDVRVFSVTEDDALVPGTVPANQPHGLRECVYPNPRSAPQVSDDPASHPLGCDLAGQGADDWYEPVESTLNEAQYAYPYAGLMLSSLFPDVTGHRYVGWHAVSAGPAPTIRSAFAVWYSYTS
jgi:hypothetical protein